MEKLLGCERICAVSISNEFKVFRQFFQMPESHSHCKDARSNPTVIGYLTADNGAFISVHDKPDISLNTSYLDVCFISGKYIAGSVIVVINERFYADCRSFAVVGNLLVGDADTMYVF